MKFIESHTYRIAGLKPDISDKLIAEFKTYGMIPHSSFQVSRLREEGITIQTRRISVTLSAEKLSFLILE